MYDYEKAGVLLAADLIADRLPVSGIDGLDGAETRVANEIAAELAKVLRRDPEHAVAHLLMYVYFIHDTLTPANVRAVRRLAEVPAVGEVISLVGAGLDGADARWRVVDREWHRTGDSATCHMTDAEES